MSEQASDRHVVILGLMGVGKSSTGRVLAQLMGRAYSDSDIEIERVTGQAGRSFASEMGIPALHELEAALLLGALARPAPHVITAAASVVENELVAQLLPKGAFVVRLTASLETTRERQADGNHRRAMGVDELAELAARREPLFNAVEDIVLDAARTTQQLAYKILDAMRSKGLFYDVR